MQTKREINNRIDLLRDAFAWSLQNNQVLTIGQRICLTQERAALLRCLASLQEDDESLVTPAYTIPQELEDKVKHIKTIINATQWQNTHY